MGITANGLPYPNPSDPVSGGADAIRALAEALDVVGGDTGWVNISVAPGFAAQGSPGPQVRRLGIVVYSRGGWQGTGLSANGTSTVGTLPVGFRPVVAAHIIRAGTTVGGASAGMFVNTNGSIEIRVGPTVTGYYFLSTSWLTT